MQLNTQALQPNTPTIIYNPNNVMFKHEVWVNDEMPYNVGNTDQTVNVRSTRLLGFYVTKRIAEKAVQKYYHTVTYNNTLKALKGLGNE